MDCEEQDTDSDSRNDPPHSVSLWNEDNEDKLRSADLPAEES